MSDTDWRALLEENFAGWSTMDPDKIRYQYDQSEGCSFFDLGIYYQGFDDYAQGAKEAMEAMETFEISLTEMYPVQPPDMGDIVCTADTCTVRLTWKDSHKGSETFDCRHTAVWRWDADLGRWLIIHEHQTKVAPNG